jgi:hypothetical protein
MKADTQFLCEYNHRGATWAVDIWADDWQDAERKLRSIGTNGRVLGPVSMEVRVPVAPARWFAAALKWWRS